MWVVVIVVGKVMGKDIGWDDAELGGRSYSDGDSDTTGIGCRRGFPCSFKRPVPWLKAT